MGRPIYICKHTSEEYSPLELKFKEIIESDIDLKDMAKELNLLHEWRIPMTETVNGKIKRTGYWLDFFSAKKNVDIEINHNGHKKGKWYMPKLKMDVFTRDKLRKKRLEERGIKVMPIYESRLTKGWIHYYLKRILKFNDAITLDKWLK